MCNLSELDSRRKALQEIMKKVDLMVDNGNPIARRLLSIEAEEIILSLMRVIDVKELVHDDISDNDNP